MSETLSEPLLQSIVSLGNDLFAMKLYWVAISALWLYEYSLTLPDEVEFAWKGDKSPVFWLFIANRYICPAFIIITLVAYFLDSFTLEVCGHYGFVEMLETVILTSLAEFFLTLRVYALLDKHRLVLFSSVFIILWQWGLAFYVMSQSSKGSDQPALLLSRRDIVPGLPTLPNIDPFHICIMISSLQAKTYAEAFLCLCLAFDGLAFIGIIVGVVIHTRRTGSFKVLPLIEVIKRDGIMYFLILFSSNLVWLQLLLYARPGLKFIHNQPAMVISSIMITRITLNLKRKSQDQSIITWSTKTFQHITGEERDRKYSDEIALNIIVSTKAESRIDH